jgi:oligoendopeptidase F
VAEPGRVPIQRALARVGGDLRPEEAAVQQDRVYCCAYAFGELLVLALVQKYKQEGAAFVPRYLDLLAAGGSEAPHVLLARLGVDVTDPGFWELGLRLLDDMVVEAERLAAQLG